ncbi:SMI1/KNR4 family protein [Helicobacter pylori]|uniref:SMI1/KNR4 family protein n=1 Tax=Helicobacter pylori TaxID=210 RepID=UPI0015E686BE|nr:SMI1/KNR4 family protein [Helicobacter pylori]MCQ2781033.1 SMI1/KNR4 family protein [Helicobacter pylori]
MKLPKDFEDYCEMYGNFNENGLEIFGTLKSQATDKLPAFQAATKLYSQHYDLEENEIVIYYDDYLNAVVVLNEEGEVFNVNLEDRQKIATSFKEWFLAKCEEFEIKEIKEF